MAASGEAARAYVVRPVGPDPRALRLLADAHALGVPGLLAIDVADLVFLWGLDSTGAAQVADALLADPLLVTVSGERAATVPGGVVVETVLHPGVTDSAAGAVERGARLLGLPAVRAATGTRYELFGDLSDDDVARLVARLLSNPVIERHAVGMVEPEPSWAGAAAPVERIALRDLDDDGLQALDAERGLALDPAELRAIRDWSVAEERDPTDVELETLAQTWSEHCAHKSFRATISWEDGGEVVPLLDQLRRATAEVGAPWVRSAFVGNAGIVAVDGTTDLALKVETHNHPSAVEPFGGANTGVGGVVRDVLGVGARPVAVTDVLCFGPHDVGADDVPAGVLHPRLVRAGVVAGVADYGNKLGLPTVAGAVVHDPGYTANPLVFCGCVGTRPATAHVLGPHPGDQILVLGGRTGRDGIRGATFSSREMDATTGEVAGASVQIGDPIVEKGLIDVVVEAAARGLFTAITDCGAGGLSSAIGEMAEGIGAEVQLDLVPRKYPGLAPWEVWLSEAQERMVVATADPAPWHDLCARHEVEVVALGRFTGDGRLVVRSGDEVVLDLATDFLHDGRPPRHLVARRPQIPEPARPGRPAFDARVALLTLLAHPSLRSQADVVRGYDHEVLGRTVLRPYTGAADDGPADAAVLAVGDDAVALGVGVNSRYGRFDAERMAHAVVDEAIRNVVAVGADPDHIALLDNFSWGDPTDPETLGQLVAAVQGCADAARLHRAPFVSGKDSLNNTYATADGQRRSVPPTLVITAAGRVPGGGPVVSSDLKRAGDVVFLVGATGDELRGSHLDLVLAVDAPGEVPAPDPWAPARYRKLHAAIRLDLVRACHDLAEGGLAVAAAEMAMGGRLGLDLTVPGEPTAGLFGESLGRFLVEVAPADVAPFVAALTGESVRLGVVVADPYLRLRAESGLVELSLDELLQAWQGHVPGAHP